LRLNVPEDTQYKDIGRLVDEWTLDHLDEKFTHDQLCREINVVSSEGRHYVSVKLRNMVVGKKLRKVDKYYVYINLNITEIDWLNAAVNDPGLNISWPMDWQNNVKFGWDSHITIPEKSILMLAGVTNTGKTAFCTNFLWMNMDKYPCTLMGNEYNAPEFFKRAVKLEQETGLCPTDAKGKPKFELIERYDGWQDVIRPNNVNIIDWINLDGVQHPFYEIGNILQQIRDKLDHGIALVVVQKESFRDAGVGGSFGEHLASVVLAMDYGRIKVKKAKIWNDFNPNGKSWGFDIGNGGCAFRNIRPVKPCGACVQGKQRGQTCPICQGTGWVDGQ
jgi:hypothetical protein